VQFVGYRVAIDGPATLSLAEGGTVRPLELAPGTELAYTLGERHCAGVVEGGDHRSCSAAPAPYCPRHTSTWACARCTGDCSKPLPACEEEHAVYLAAFAPDTFKVGVTRSWRLETRLREQGADRAAHIRTVADGRRARRIEAGIAERLTDRVRTPTKLAGLGRPVDAEAWEALLSEFDPIERFTFEYGLDFDERPVPDTVATGTVLGTKGKLLLVERGGTAYAVNLRDLVGYEVAAGASERDRQATLGSF
jgi:hypothetical protein